MSAHSPAMEIVEQCYLAPLYLLLRLSGFQCKCTRRVARNEGKRCTFNLLEAVMWYWQVQEQKYLPHEFAAIQLVRLNSTSDMVSTGDHVYRSAILDVPVQCSHLLTDANYIAS